MTNSLIGRTVEKTSGENQTPLRKFIIASVVAELLYLYLFLVRYLKTYFGGVEMTIDTGTLENKALYTSVIIMLLIQLFLYMRLYGWVRRGDIAFRFIFFFTVLFNLTLLFVWPTTSTDVYTYVNRSRLITTYHENPYIVPYSSHQEDLFYDELHNKWSDNTQIYGGLFVGLGAVLTTIGGDSLAANILLFKFVFMLFNILAVVILYKLANPLAAFLYGFNPLILFELAHNGHNDVLQVALVLFGIYVLSQYKTFRWLLVGWIVLVCSVMVKYFSVLFLPVYFFIAVKRLERKERLLFFVLAVVIALVIPVASFAPFWEGPQTFQRLAELTTYYNRFTSPVVAIMTSFLNIFHFPYSDLLSIFVARFSFIILYVAVLVKIIFQKTISTKQIVLYSILIYGSFLGLFFTRLFPWYFSTFIALCIIYLATVKNKRAEMLFFMMTFILLFLIQ